MKISSVIIALFACVSTAACGSKEQVSPTVAKIVERPPFNADSAFAYVSQQVGFGPRVPGSEAHARCRQWLVDRLQSADAAVELLDTVVTSPDGQKVAIHNILGHIRPDATKRVMLLAHYDTRPWADMDPDTDAHHRPIDGANDGASGVAVILEVIRNIDAVPTTTGLDILFVDCEDSGNYADDASWCLGSQAFAASMSPTGKRPDYAILLDMVGGKDALFYREQFSNVYARTIVDRVWNTAASLGYSDRFIQQIGGAINDDHIHLLGAGIPAIDIVEMSHPQTKSFNSTWHTLSDNISNIDPATMKIVGETILKTLTR